MKRTTLLISASLILLALALLSSASQGPHGDAEAFRIANETQDLAQKAQKLDAFIKQYPDSSFTPLAFLNLIGIYDQQNNCTQLVKYIDEADSKGILAKAGIDDAGLAKIYYRAYDCVKSQGKQAGIKYLDKIISLAQKHNRDANWQTTLTQVQNLKKSLTAPPPPTEPPVNTAIRHYNEKKYSEAAAAFQKLDQKDAKVANYHGLTLFRLEKYADAVNKIITAGLLDSEAYPKALDTAKSIFTTNAYKVPGSGKAYNDRLKEISNLANKEMVVLNKAFNDKWAEKEIEEGSEEEKLYDQEYEKLQSDIAKVQSEAQETLTQIAAQLDKAFNDLVEKIRKDLK